MPILSRHTIGGLTYHKIDRVGAQGPSLFLLHGFGCQGAAFSGIVPCVSAYAKLIIPDWRAHGASITMSRAPSLNDLARDFRALLEKEARGRVVVLGWSMGASVLFEYWAVYQGQGIDRLVIQDMSPKPQNTPDWFLGVKNSERFPLINTALLIRQSWSAFSS